MQPQVRICRNINSWLVIVTDNYESWFFGFIRRKAEIVFSITWLNASETEYRKFYSIAKTQALEVAAQKGVTLVYSGKAESLNQEIAILQNA